MEKVSVDAIVPEMIAPCGMNCALCSGFLREKRICSGCRSDSSKPAYCASCKIRNCVERVGEFCSDCSKPCRRMRDLDKRYRTRYGMSMLENLALIRDEGISAFVAGERKRWECPQCHGVLSVHRSVCVFCGFEAP